MDRQLEKKRITPKRVIYGSTLVIFLGLILFALLNDDNTSELKVASNRLSIATVESGDFVEYYPFEATVIPKTSVFLDVEEGGTVDEILIEGGEPVTKGDLILRISNASLQRSSIDTETRLLENLDQIRNTQFNREQSQLILKDSLLDLSYQLDQLSKDKKRYDALVEVDGISRQEYDAISDKLIYLQQKKQLLEERMRQEEALSKQQLEQASRSIERLNTSLDLMSNILLSLEIRAPISGHLSNIDANLGERIAQGQRIGQIDLLDEFKLQAAVDEYYSYDITTGTTGHFELNDQSYQVSVSRVYSEVVNNEFLVDLEFVADKPADLRRGQTLNVELSFSEPKQSITVKKGGFYQQTSGRWVYLISEDGTSARKIMITSGKQNPQQVEVLEGLQPGDRIISSSYSFYNEADVLIFDEPIN